MVLIDRRLNIVYEAVVAAGSNGISVDQFVAGQVDQDKNGWATNFTTLKKAGLIIETHVQRRTRQAAPANIYKDRALLPGVGAAFVTGIADIDVVGVDDITTTIDWVWA